MVASGARLLYFATENRGTLEQASNCFRYAASFYATITERFVCSLPWCAAPNTQTPNIICTAAFVHARDKEIPPSVDPCVCIVMNWRLFSLYRLFLSLSAWCMRQIKMCQNDQFFTTCSCHQHRRNYCMRRGQPPSCCSRPLSLGEVAMYIVRCLLGVGPGTCSISVHVIVDALTLVLRTIFSIRPRIVFHRATLWFLVRYPLLR